MAKNYIQQGDVLDWTNGTGSAVSSGDPVVIGNEQMGIALVDIANAATGSVAKCGVFSLPKNTSDAVTAGHKVWWDAANAEVINEPAINSYFIGYAVAAELAETATVKVQLEEFAEEGPRVITLAATGNQALNAGDFGGGDVIVFAPNTAALTLALAAVAAISPGSKLFVKKTSADAFAVTLDPAASETIAGGATFATIDAANDLAQFVSNGAAWVLMHSTIA
jgi:predicted RecA/RadA family phage recombinase